MTAPVIHQPDPSLPWAPRVILRTEVGSTAHGTGLDGVEDYDEMGVYIPPWQEWVGVSPRQLPETITYRPGRGPEDRSGPGDYDLVVHDARKFARLAATGNPSILMALYGPTRFVEPLGKDLLRLRDAFMSDRARRQFLGYAKAQRERLLGIRGGRHTNRPELEAEHGYDTKYAMHMVRLGIQGREYMTTGQISSPVPPGDRELLLAIRRGELKLDSVLALAEENEAALSIMVGRPEPEWARIDQWLSACYFHAVQRHAFR